MAIARTEEQNLFRVTTVSNLLERSSNTLIIGSIIQGRYQVLSKVKGGALSRTYLVQDMSQPNEPKCILKHYPYNKEIPRLYKTNMRLFLKEAKHLQVLSVHPRIPRLIDYFGITDQGWYLIQERIEGRLLNTTLPMSEYSDNCWTVQEVADLIKDVCETLQFIHSQKIIHCDLKPNNLIRRALDNHLEIIDFGGAQYMPGFQTAEDATVASLRTKITVSPSGYLAPEQLNGQPQVGSDIYALGIIAIQAWTGLDPARMKKDSHTGELVWDQYVKIEDPETCRQLVGIISRMVHPDVGDRYRHTRDILTDLDVLLNSLVDHPQATEGKTFISQADQDISDYVAIAFDDTELFQKPDPNLSEKATMTDDGVTLLQSQPIPAKPKPTPEIFSKQTIIQEDPSDLIQMMIKEELGEDLEDAADQTQVADFTEAAPLATTERTIQIQGRRSPIKNLPLMAAFSVSVVIVNALLIAFGLQHLIGSMAITEGATPTPPTPPDDLQRAQAAYAQGNFQEAIAIAKAIPQTSPAYTDAQASIQNWQTEWQANAKQVEAIITAHNAKDWQQVIALSQKLGNNALAKQKVTQLVTAAQFEIDVAAYQRVQKAFNLAADYQFENALTTLKDAPPNSKFAPVISEKLTEYANKKQLRAQYYFQQAVNHAEAREFKEAVTLLEQIDPDTKPHAIAEIKIVEYSEKQKIKEAYERWITTKSQRANHTTKPSSTPMAQHWQASPDRIAQVNPGAIWQGIA